MSHVKLILNLRKASDRRLMRACLDALDRENDEADLAALQETVDEAVRERLATSSGAAVAPGDRMDGLEDFAGAAPAEADLVAGHGRTMPPETPGDADRSPGVDDFEGRRLLDPKRFLDDADKVRAWTMSRGGAGPSVIARALNRDLKQIQNYIGNVRGGRSSVPQLVVDPVPAPGTAVAVRPATHCALVDQKRPVARDPEIVAQWQDELAEAERLKAVHRSIYPKP